MGTYFCLWYVDYFCCSRNRIPLMTDVPSPFITGSAFLYTILSNTYLFPIVISVRDFEDCLESFVNLFTNGCCKLFRVISKINVRLRSRGSSYPGKLISQYIYSQPTFLIICPQPFLTSCILLFLPA